MKVKKIIWLTILICLCEYQFSLSQVSGGGFAESYLLRNVGARATSMAGAYTAVVNEPMGLFYNPAGLANLSPKAMFSTSFSLLEYSRTHSVITWGQSFEKVGIGIGVNNYTTGTFTARDARGDVIGEFSDWQYAITGGLAYSLEFMSAGASIKYLANSLSGSGTNANGYSIDLGTKFNVFDLFSFGMAIQNIAGSVYWNTPSEEADILPFTLRSGVAMEFGLNDSKIATRNTVSGEVETINIPATKYILASLDAVFTQWERRMSFILGVEAVPLEIIAVRGGLAVLGDDLGTFKILPMNIWGAGVSLRPPLDALPFELHIDYGASNDHLAKNKIAHHLSLIVQF